MGFLPRLGGVMDQDPLELEVMDIALKVFEEKREIEEDKNKPKGH